MRFLLLLLVFVTALSGCAREHEGYGWHGAGERIRHHERVDHHGHHGGHGEHGHGEHGHGGGGGHHGGGGGHGGHH